MRFFDRVKTPTPPASPTVQSPVSARPVTVNPTDAQQIAFAKYRTDAIARDIGQRKAEGRPKNKHHDQMLGEAMMYGHMLVAAGAWTPTELARFQIRLEEVK